MLPLPITDPQDPRLADYRALTDVALRTAFEPPHGLFVAEGELVLRRALRAGYRPRSFLVDAKRVDQIPPTDAPVYAAEPGVLEAITGFHVHRGVLASFHRKPLPSSDELLAQSRRVAILEDVNNHTNLGAVFRGAAALGIDAVLLSPSCADPLYRRSVRVSMGEVFAIPYATLEPWPLGLEAVREHGFGILAMTPALDAVALRDAPVGEKTAILLGAEGPGLSQKAIAASDIGVRIPMRRGVDSLNVAAAAAVAFYELGRAD